MLEHPLDWPSIDTVLLDMDGTLLDLAFDNFFWMRLIPQTLSQRDGITIEQAQQRIYQAYQRVQHSMQWYCFDYWSGHFRLDIKQMTHQHRHRIKLREDTIPFLTRLKQMNKRVILLTNAHPDGLAIKMRQVSIAPYFEQTISTHRFGIPKENPQLWQKLAAEIKFNPAHTLFIDDAEPILNTASNCGIRYCLGVENPDSGLVHKQRFNAHPSFSHYGSLFSSPLDYRSAI